MASKANLRKINLALVSFGFLVIFTCGFSETRGAQIETRNGGKRSPLMSQRLALGSAIDGFQKAGKKSVLKWAPPNVDVPIATLSSTDACSLADVLGHAGERATELVANLQSFTAQEKIEYAYLDYNGSYFANSTGTVASEYAASFDQKPGALAIHEARSPSRGANPLPNEFQSSGLIALGLVFHPYYQGDFEMRCEGMDQWNGHAAWVIHFQQRDDKPVRIHSFRSPDGVYKAKLKGRGWISADTGQILHIETNLKEALPEIHLQSEAISVDYAPVEFHSKNMKLWLPQVAEVFFKLREQRQVVLHTFTDFLLSSVQTEQTLGQPHPK